MSINALEQRNKQRIKVFVRARPPLGNELAEEGAYNCIKTDHENNVMLLQPMKEEKAFTFDKVFGPKDNNNAVFEHVAKETIDVCDEKMVNTHSDRIYFWDTMERY
jgi:hypothetical protein